ncbi:MAG: hypothetical protein ACO1OB_20225 [Archangium sp.]
MNEQRIEEKNDRRNTAPASTIWSELVAENAWRPQDKPRYQTDGWLRMHGYLPDRRTK